jgi:hypothetical protein
MGFNILAQVLFLVSLKAQKPFTAEARSTPSRLLKNSDL